MRENGHNRLLMLGFGTAALNRLVSGLYNLRQLISLLSTRRGAVETLVRDNVRY